MIFVAVVAGAGSWGLLNVFARLPFPGVDCKDGTSKSLPHPTSVLCSVSAASQESDRWVDLNRKLLQQRPASRDVVSGQEDGTDPTEGVDVLIEEDQDDRIHGRVGPRDERQQLVDLGRLVELGIEESQQIERVPAEYEQSRDQDQDSGSAQRSSHDRSDRLLIVGDVAARYRDRRSD